MYVYVCCPCVAHTGTISFRCHGLDRTGSWKEEKSHFAYEIQYLVNELCSVRGSKLQIRVILVSNWSEPTLAS